MNQLILRNFCHGRKSFVTCFIYLANPYKNTTLRIWLGCNGFATSLGSHFIPKFTCCCKSIYFWILIYCQFSRKSPFSIPRKKKCKTKLFCPMLKCPTRHSVPSHFVLKLLCPPAILSSTYLVLSPFCLLLRRHFGSRDFVRTPKFRICIDFT